MTASKAITPLPNAYSEINWRILHGSVCFNRREFQKTEGSTEAEP